MYAHTLGAAVGLGYVTDPGGAACVPTARSMPTPTRSRWPACGNPRIASLRPLYDPKNERIKR